MVDRSFEMICRGASSAKELMLVEYCIYERHCTDRGLEKRSIDHDWVSDGEHVG